MKKNLFVFLLLIFSTFSVFAQDVKLITYNLRYENSFDVENAWAIRKNKIVEMLEFYEPDVFGVQEGLNSQIYFLDSNLTEYDHVGLGRDDGKTAGEYSAIFYKKNRFEVLQTSTFWLSKTPDTVSIGWDAACKRICTYALFKDKLANNKFWVFNTHFDHVGEKAREQSARLIIDRIHLLNQEHYSVVLMGDFNLTPEKEPIQFISSKLWDARVLFKSKSPEDDGTFNNFEYCKIASERIDYFFVSGCKVKKYRVLKDSYLNKYPSDHFPVMLQVKFSTPIL